jgi:hypothetical protein
MIPIYIGDTSIRCGEPNDMKNTPTITPVYQHIPITINNVIPTIFKPNDIIDIASDGGLKRDHATFGVTISINQQLVIEMQGSLPSQIHVTSLTSEAYGCYYAIKKLHEKLNTFTGYSSINILLDNKTLISRINELIQYKPFPTVCLKSEFEVIAAIVDILPKLPNVNLKHIQSKSNNNKNMDDKILH